MNESENHIRSKVHEVYTVEKILRGVGHSIYDIGTECSSFMSMSLHLIEWVSVHRSFTDSTLNLGSEGVRIWESFTRRSRCVSTVIGLNPNYMDLYPSTYLVLHSPRNGKTPRIKTSLILLPRRTRPTETDYYTMMEHGRHRLFV